MADNATDVVLKGGIDGLNSTVNGTAPAMSAWETLQDMSFLALELQLLFGAIGIIYVGAHAALRRPPSAAPSKPRKPGQRRRGDDEEEERVAGMELSDAIMFPIMAGIMLVGMYYLIQWLKDPEILNKILRWYMSVMSLFSVLTLYAHGIDVAVSFVFPHYWRARDGSLRAVDQKARLVSVCDDAGNPIDGREATSNPCPGPLSLLVCTERIQKAVWDLRELLVKDWCLKFYVRGMGEEKTNIRFSHAVALAMAAITTVAYYSTNSTFLSNMLGYGMCYGSFLLISPTDLMIGSLVLGGLFFYDIFMVFYTPYMVTVATKLDVPIKLTFKAAKRQSILGLGDIVIPGILMGWALRLDLWMHYRRKIKYESQDLKIVEKEATTGAITTRSETKHREIKAPYVNVKGTWGDTFWTSRGILGSRHRVLPAELAEANFRKPYFTATVVGYGLGMLVTLSMLLIFKRGQPALLYLVPGVLGSLYLTALARGEFKDIWSYTEDGSIDKVDVVVELDSAGREVKRIGKLENGIVDTTKDDKDEKDKNGKDSAEERKGGEKETDADGDKTDGKKRQKRHEVIMLALEDLGEDEDE